MPAPEISFQPINAKGEILVEFDQPMIAPKEIDLKIYPTVFRILAKSAEDGTTYVGRFVKKLTPKEKRRMQA